MIEFFAPKVVHTIPPEESIEQEGLLTEMKVAVLVTSDVSMEKELNTYGNPLDTIWKNCIFGFCGSTDVTCKYFNSVFQSTPTQRQSWLNETRNLIQSTFD